MPSEKTSQSANVNLFILQVCVYYILHLKVTGPFKIFFFNKSVFSTVLHLKGLSGIRKT